MGYDNTKNKVSNQINEARSSIEGDRANLTSKYNGDELAGLKKLPMLKMALSELRKYGGCILASTQAISQLHSIYGAYDAKIMVSQFNTKAFFKNTDPGTAVAMGVAFGETKIEIKTENVSYGVHEMYDGVNIGTNIKTRKVVTENMLANLEPLECFISLHDKSIIGVKIKMPFVF